MMRCSISAPSAAGNQRLAGRGGAIPAAHSRHGNATTGSAFGESGFRPAHRRRTLMSAVRFRDATVADVPTITALQNAAADALTARVGHGPWSATVTERSTLAGLQHARLRVGREGSRIVTVLRLATAKPWAIDAAFFTPVRKPLYITGMAVAVAEQGRGLGRHALEDAVEVAREWPADAIRLDAYEGAGGAGPFYCACGFTDRGENAWRDTALHYYELLIS
jgi:GNAT superfamily N-acetyltransferase